MLFEFFFQKKRNYRFPVRSIFPLILLMSKLSKYAFFYTQHFYKHRQAEDGKKKTNTKQHLEAELLLLKIIRITRPRYHLKVIGHYKN